MSYEHCKEHDMDATNGCPECIAKADRDRAEYRLCEVTQSVEARAADIRHFMEPDRRWKHSPEAWRHELRLRVRQLIAYARQLEEMTADLYPPERLD
jgi:uncharacterized protein YfaQ (DUF2300 family)